MKQIPTFASLLLLLAPLLNCQFKDMERPGNALLNAPFSSSPHDRAVSRQSGVAPLAVHFFADFVASAAGSERINRFHNYEYIWDFGDAGSGTWVTSGRSANSARGAVAVHIFEHPGDYEVNLAIRDHDGIVAMEQYAVTVDDPDEIYSGSATISVNNEGDSDFTGAPEGALTISTDDLATIPPYAVAGSRILFKRSSSWEISESLNWPGNAGPVTIGAYGPGGTADALGIQDNAPRIQVNNCRFMNSSFKQDWRITDLHLRDPGRTSDTFSGAISMRQHLFLRLKIEGFSVGLGWSHWNHEDLMHKDDMVIALCDVSDSAVNVMYVGSERLALVGNIIRDARQSHVVRVWQAYRSVISHNLISGSSLDTSLGRHALKFHGPGVRSGGSGGSLGQPRSDTGLADVKTQFTIIADNVFGSSGPWPVAIGPQDGGADERVSHIIFEGNRLHADFGMPSVTPVQVSLMAWGRHLTFRNNIFDGTGASNGYAAMVIERRGVEPAPSHVAVYHNTVYRGDAATGSHRGFVVRREVAASLLMNNLVSFPEASGSAQLVDNGSAALQSAGNVFTATAMFVTPGAVNPLEREFTLEAASSALGQGVTVPVYYDFMMNPRPRHYPDSGALER